MTRRLDPRLVLTLCTAGLGVIVAGLVVIDQDRDASSLLGQAGLLMLVIAGALLSWHGWSPPRDPRAEVDADGLRLPQSPRIRWHLVVGATGVLLLATSFLVGGSLEEQITEQRRGIFLVPFLVLAPLVWSGALVALARRPSSVLLSPDELVLTGAFSRRTVRWPDVDQRISTRLPNVQPAASARAATTLVEHYRQSPDDRSELTTEAALHRLQRIEDRDA